MDDARYMEEWTEICKAYCDKANAKLLFVNIDSFGCEYSDGTMKHIYADELEDMLK